MHATYSHEALSAVGTFLLWFRAHNVHSKRIGANSERHSASQNPEMLCNMSRLDFGPSRNVDSS